MTQPSLLAIAFQDVKADMSASESSLDKRTGVLDVKQGRRMDEVKLAIKARVGKLDRVLAGGGQEVLRGLASALPVAHLKSLAPHRKAGPAIDFFCASSAHGGPIPAP